MAMTLPAAPVTPVFGLPDTTTEEEIRDAVGVVASGYTAIRDTMRRNRGMVIRRLGPYFRTEVYHQPMIPKYSRVPLSHDVVKPLPCISEED